MRTVRCCFTVFGCYYQSWRFCNYQKTFVVFNFLLIFLPSKMITAIKMSIRSWRLYWGNQLCNIHFDEQQATIGSIQDCSLIPFGILHITIPFGGKKVQWHSVLPPSPPPPPPPPPPGSGVEWFLCHQPGMGATAKLQEPGWGNIQGGDDFRQSSRGGGESLQHFYISGWTQFSKM